ncbi:hypothetical protein [Haloactinomyces albus]|uniref:Transposase IS116/IS110/IS902 family protein n=1 Tax=Haloactinomyces albus TaxID=1352928 RepID=A0AAE4CQV1_9ACTN|nr:hypothetical protein [Haloactinomyces albus]MDR7304482.1 hypothetical protein [Haloactinomyces albus]
MSAVVVVAHRRVKNNRLATVGYSWAFMAMTNSPHAKVHYRRRKDSGDRHAALRHLFNKMLGQPFHCLHSEELYNPIRAFGDTPPATST